MDLSKSETLTLCQRFFAALGLPPGIDNEAAESIVWLASRGYPSLDDLSQSNPEISRIRPITRQLEKDSNCGSIIATDMYYDAWIEIADWLLTSCLNSPQGKSHLQLIDVRNSYFILPTLLQRSSQGYEFNVEVASGQTVFSDGNLWTTSVTNQLLFLEEQDKMDIHCAQTIEIDTKMPSRQLIFSSEMRSADEQLIQTERSRIKVKDEIYWKLKKVAAKCFVPASEHSRQRGAGAEVDDSA